MAKITGKRVIDKLMELGIADENTQRVIIDIRIDGIPIIHVQKVGDDRILNLVEIMDHVEIQQVPAELIRTLHGCEMGSSCMWDDTTGLHSDGSKCLYSSKWEDDHAVANTEREGSSGGEENHRSNSDPD